MNMEYIYKTYQSLNINVSTLYNDAMSMPWCQKSFVAKNLLGYRYAKTCQKSSTDKNLL